MKKPYTYFITLWLCLNLFCTYSKGEALVDTSFKYTEINNDKGVVVSLGYLRKGTPDGYWKTFYDNGVLKSEGNRKDYLLDSLWNFYNSEGLLITTINYKAGKKNGYKVHYNPDNQTIIMKENFIDDLRNGMTLFFKQGFLSKQIPYVDGKENGIGKEFLKDSTVITISNYKNGFITREEKINRTDYLGRKQGVFKLFFDMSDHEKIVATYSDDKLNGYLKEYNLRGDLIKTEKWVDGVLQKSSKESAKIDIKREFYDNGVIKSYGTSRNGLLEGITRYYDETGRLVGSKFYKNGSLSSEGVMDEKGLQQGIWKEYYPEGEIKSQGLYENGRKIGEWKYFHQNKVIEQIGTYDKGKPKGNWKWYYDNGQLLRTETFEFGKLNGEFIEYSEKGDVILKGEFSDGEANGQWLIVDNDINESGIFKDGLKFGEWITTYNSNNNTYHKGLYINGLENGKHIYYHDNGRISEEGSFILGQKVDKWKFYGLDGGLVTILEYRNGEDYKIDGANIPYNKDTILNDIPEKFTVKDTVGN
jgi:antitoxin component YwqK of YwqJK toxin-antitoxin module